MVWVRLCARHLGYNETNCATHNVSTDWTHFIYLDTYFCSASSPQKKLKTLRIHINHSCTGKTKTTKKQTLSHHCTLLIQFLFLSPSKWPPENNLEVKVSVQSSYENPWVWVIFQVPSLILDKGLIRERCSKPLEIISTLTSSVPSWGKSRRFSSKIIFNPHPHFNYWCISHQ